jgi:hypothetical protein
MGHTLLEQNQSKRALVKNREGSFFLRKKSLEAVASGYSYSDFAIANASTTHGTALVL